MALAASWYSAGAITRLTVRMTVMRQKSFKTPGSQKTVILFT